MQWQNLKVRPLEQDRRILELQTLLGCHKIRSGEIFLFLDKDTKLATSIVRRSLSLVALTCTNREDIDQSLHC